MTTTTRQYIAKHYDPDTKQVVRERIIDAPNRIAAMNHAAATTIEIELLTVADARRLAHVPVEIATQGKATNVATHPEQQSLLGDTASGDTAAGGEPDAGAAGDTTDADHGGVAATTPPASGEFDTH